jgi:hypothetical protein
LIARSNSFPGQAIPTGGKYLIGAYYQRFADGTPLALGKTDEVARNGVLQRITSARGFL